MDEPSEQQYSPSDFIYGPTIGEGRFGTVIYAELKPAEQDPTAAAADVSSSQHDSRSRDRCRGYAIKVIPKCEIFRRNQIHAVMTEKHILCEVLSSKDPSELFMKLFLSFHDESFVYFVLELCAGGTLLGLIQSRARDSIDPESPVIGVSWVEYYSGQVLRAIEYLHQRGVVHRDISPQNIALTFPNGEIKLGDFGGAAILEAHKHEGGSKRLGMQDGVIESNTACHSTETGLKRYLSIRDHSFFHTAIWNSLETKIMEPPYKPAQPKWMAELYRGDNTLESFESIRFDL